MNNKIKSINTNIRNHLYSKFIDNKNYLNKYMQAIDLTYIVSNVLDKEFPQPLIKQYHWPIHQLANRFILNLTEAHASPQHAATQFLTGIGNIQKKIERRNIKDEASWREKITNQTALTKKQNLR